MINLRYVAAFGLLMACSSATWAQPRYVELPTHPLSLQSGHEAGRPIKAAQVESIVGGPTTELRAVQTASGQWQLRCEQLDAEGPSSYHQWLERLARHQEVLR